MRITTIVACVLLSYTMSFAQSARVDTRAKLDSTKAAIPTELGYKELRGIGIGALALKDEATSPLIYRGILFSPFRSKVKRKSTYETTTGFRPLLGFTLSNFNSEVDLSGFFAADFYYTYLRKIPKFSFFNIDILVGGTFDFTTVVRANPSLQNNTIGFDLFPTLMGSVKLNKSFIGKSLWGEKFSLWNMFKLGQDRPMVHQEVSFQMDVGILNTNFRNGYAYTIHAPFYNNRNFFSDHEFNWFSGMRIRTNVSYLVFSSRTKNGVKFSYTWEGVRSGENPDRFSFTNGMLQFSLIHRLY